MLAVFLAILAERGWQWLRRRAAAQWPLAEGRIEKSEWRQPNTGTNRYFVVDLAYSYRVERQYYAGYFSRAFFRREEAAAFAERMRGRDVRIRYQAANHAASLLREEDLREPVPEFALSPESD